MENIENINEGVETVVNDFVTETTPGMSNGAAIAVGVGLVAVIGTAIGVGKLLWDKHKEKKEQAQAEHNFAVGVADTSVANDTAK